MNELEQLRETARSFGEAVRLLDLISTRLVVLEQHQGELLALSRGMWVNDALWSGGIAVGAGTPWEKSFKVPFAGVLIDDVNSIGPINVSGSAGEINVAGVGPGRWLVPVGQRRVVPLTGSGLTIQATGAGELYIAVFVKAVIATVP